MYALKQDNCTSVKDESVTLFRKIEGAWLYFSDVPRTDDREMHAHDCVLMTFLLRGAITEIDEAGYENPCEPYSLHAHPAGSRHAHLVQSSRVTRLCFSIRDDLLQAPGMDVLSIDRPMCHNHGPVAALAPRFHREVMASDTASELVLRGLIYELAGEVARSKDLVVTTKPPPWLRRVKEMLRDSTEQNLTIEEVAAAVGVHPSHLSRTFRTHVGQSPGEYVRRLRIERSTRWVLTSDMPLKAIAARSGFTDQAHFTREFKRFNGQTPSEMRKSFR